MASCFMCSARWLRTGTARGQTYSASASFPLRLPSGTPMTTGSARSRSTAIEHSRVILDKAYSNVLSIFRYLALSCTEIGCQLGYVPYCFTDAA